MYPKPYSIYLRGTIAVSETASTRLLSVEDSEGVFVNLVLGSFSG